MLLSLAWLEPVLAQEKAKRFVVQDDKMIMDKAPSIVEKTKLFSARQFETNSVRQLDNEARLLKLTESEKSEMVRSSMRAAFVPKAGGIGPHSFIGGAYLSEDLGGFGYAVRFTIDENPSLVQDLKNPVATADGLSGFPLRGTWNGQFFEGCWAAMNPYSGEIMGFFGYYVYEPATNQVRQLKAKVLETGLNPYDSFIAYDYSENTVYALQNYGHEADGEYVWDSLVAFRAMPNTGTYTSVGKVSGIGRNILSMTVTKEGTMYAIAVDGSLYSINADTWSAVKVGATGIQPMEIYQSMAADYRSGKLYWNYFDADADYGMAEVDATTGMATVKGTFLNVLSCMASLYYPANQPEDIADFGLEYRDGKVMVLFTVPALTKNGDELDGLDTVEIFNVSSGSPGERVWARQEPVPGEKIRLELENIGTEGQTVTLAVRAKDKDGKYSAASNSSVLLFNVTLPYVNGFEDDESSMMAAISVADPENKGGMERTVDEKHGGNYAYKMSGVYVAGDGRRLTIQGMPVKKGGIYRLSLWAKTNATRADGIVYAFDGAQIASYFPVSSQWEQVGLAYEAKAAGQMSFTMAGYGALSEEVGANYFIDDVKVEEISSPDVPAAMNINAVTAAADGSLKANVNVTLPTLTMADEPLLRIDSIVIFASTATGFTANLSGTVVKDALVPGETKDFEITVPKAGQYYVRAMIYNEKGSCPYWSNYANEAGTSYQRSPWIGSDLPSAASLKITATPQTDGTVELSWQQPVAAHGGYVGEVTYTLKEGETGLYTGKETVCTTTKLPLGMHVFRFEYANDQETKFTDVYTLAGLGEGMIYSNVSSSTESRVLNVSATAANSGFAQMLYPATGQATYIDTLLLFATAPATGQAGQYTKIYMGTTDMTAFGGTQYKPAKDFVEKAGLVEVFADTLRFKAGENMLRLPLKGFYYDGTKTLAMSIVKPMQEQTSFAAAVYVAVSENNMLKYRTAPSTSIDFDTVSSYNEYTGTPNAFSVSMATMPARGLKTLEVSVDSAAFAALEGAIVHIVNKGGKNLDVTVVTDAAGKASFAHMPEGTYLVTVQEAGYIASTQEVVIEQTSPVSMRFSLIKAKELVVGGTVTDKGGNKLGDVAVKAAGLAEFTAVTDAEGKFELQGVYGPGEYTLSFSKAGMEELSMALNLAEKDSVIEDAIRMSYRVVDVPMASVKLEEGKAVVDWVKPAVSTMVSWTASKPDQVRRLTIDEKSAFKYAQRFMPADLTALELGSEPKALRFGFVPGSLTAKYTVVLASDTVHELYRQEVPADKLVENTWCNIDIPDDVAIDVTKQLWLIVEVSAGENQGYACAATATGTVSGKGNLMNYNGKWRLISDLFSSGQGNVLIRLLVKDESSQVDPVNGYRVYRGLLEDDFEDYTLLTGQPVKALTYTDASYASLPFGRYNYAVVSDWYGDDFSEPVYTNILNKDMEFTVTFKLTSNAGSAGNAAIYLVNAAMTRDYEAVAASEGQAVIHGMWRDVYDYQITLPYHKTVEGKLGLLKDTTLVIAMEEIILSPELTAAVEGKDVVVDYGVNLHNWLDDAESYEDFAISGFEPWILSPGVKKGGVQGCKWTNYDVEQSWIVLNPSQTRPALSWSAWSGEKYFVSMYRASQTETESDDWLVRPVTKGGGVFTFYCRAAMSQYPESFDVVYSTTTSDFAEFKVLPEGSIPFMNNPNWTRGRFDIPADARFVGIHCKSDDAFGFLVDDLSYVTEEFVKPVGYELYLDGTKVASVPVDELAYRFTNLSDGEHKVGVKAVFASGYSELVEETVTVSSEAMPVRLKAETSGATAVLSWEMPAGFTPESYKVFLGDEQKAEGLTATTYAFNDLKNGKYTAAVVAVYATGESQKATVDFEIEGVDVEDFAPTVQAGVYPNPCDGLFYLKAAGQGMAEVYGMNGQLVRRVEVPCAGVYAIDLRNRAKGLYLLRFGNGEDIRLFKLVIR